MTNFQVGQKVVCIDDSGLAGQRRSRAEGAGGMVLLSVPVVGTVYTVREIDHGLRLVEIPNPICFSIFDGCCEPSFRATRFRPVVESKTDISIFREILNDPDKNIAPPKKQRAAVS